MMKILTFEVSNCSLVVTTVVQVGGQWNCSLALSQQDPGCNEVIHRSARSFSGVYDPQAALEIGSDFTNSFIEDCFPDLIDIADLAIAS